MSERMGRHLYFEEIANFRDLGGYNTKKGEILKEGKIFRSSMLYGPTKHDKQKWEQLGINTIIDLRAPKELAREPNPYEGFVSTYENVNLSGGKDAGRSGELAKTANNPYFMSERYLEYLKEKDEIAKAFHLFLEQKNTPLVYHCSAGKDRTGVISYLLLSLHDVLLAEIVADYQVSYTYIKQDSRILDPSKNLNIYVSFPETMEIFHKEFIKEYKTIENYFHHIDFSDDEITELKQLLL